MSFIEIVPVFGTSVTVYMPIMMIIVAALTFFNFFGRLLRVIGVESEESALGSVFYCIGASGRTAVLSEEDTERLDAGKKLVCTELKNLEKARSARSAGGAAAAITSVPLAATSSSSSTTSTGRKSVELIAHGRNASVGGRGAGQSMLGSGDNDDDDNDGDRHDDADRHSLFGGGGVTRAGN